MSRPNFKFYNFSNGTYIHHSLVIFETNVWSYYYNNGYGWFRLFGKGLKWKNSLIHGLNFSERNGYSKVLKIGKWNIGFL